MPKIKAKDILIPTLALVIICTVTTGLLAVTNEVTKEPIAQAEQQSRQESMKSVSPEGTVSYEEIATEDDSALCYSALDSNGNVIAYIISTSASGYGGKIKVMTGINAEDGTVIAVNVYDNSDETPGLGAKTSEDKFSGQFGGNTAENGFAVSKDADKYPDSTTVDAVTGATISSRAVVSAVNQAVEIYNQVSGGVE